LGAKRPGEAAYALLFSPDGKRILTATESVTIWDVKTGRRLFVFPDLHQCTFGSPATLSVNFSPDSKRLVQLANGGSRVIVWNLVQGRQVCVMGEGIFSCTVSFSPDGKTVLTASHEPGLPGTARTWDARTGRLLRVVAGHTGRVFQALYTGDGRKILTASRDGFAKLWDASTGQELRRFQNGGPGPIDRVSLSRDGKRFISKWSLQRSDESTIMPIATLWDTESGREIAQLTNHVEGIVGFAPGDERFMVVKDGSPVALMDGATGKVIRRY
jgi:WD40 repeat protein